MRKSTLFLKLLKRPSKVREEWQAINASCSHVHHAKPREIDDDFDELACTEVAILSKLVPACNCLLF